MLVRCNAREAQLTAFKPRSGLGPPPTEGVMVQADLYRGKVGSALKQAASKSETPLRALCVCVGGGAMLLWARQEYVEYVVQVQRRGEPPKHEFPYRQGLQGVVLCSIILILSIPG